MSEHCKDALEKLYTYLDDELDSESVAVIKGHVDECAPCGGAFAFEERLLIAIRSGLSEEIPAVVMERIRTTIRTEIR